MCLGLHREQVHPQKSINTAVDHGLEFGASVELPCLRQTVQQHELVADVRREDPRPGAPGGRAHDSSLALLTRVERDGVTVPQFLQRQGQSMYEILQHFLGKRLSCPRVVLAQGTHEPTERTAQLLFVQSIRLYDLAEI